MPNWTENNVTIKSKSKTHLDMLVERLKSEDNVFDFNNVVPMPKEIDPHKPLGNEDRKNPNWYDWSVENWGTKWNSVDAVVERISDTEIDYFFLTAWCPPVEIYLALVNRFNKFGNHEFEWTCLDEDERDTPYSLCESDG